MLSSHLYQTLEMPGQTNFAALGRHLPVRWIEQAVHATGVASVRRRRLPAEQVIWLVIALALYRHQSMAEVLDTLDLALPRQCATAVSKIAIT